MPLSAGSRKPSPPSAGQPSEIGRLWGTAVAQNDLGNSTASQAALAALIARYSQEKSDAGPYQVAQVYASRGDPDRAFEWLNRSVAERDSGIAALKYDLFLRKVRDDPRYKLLLKSVKLPAD